MERNATNFPQIATGNQLVTATTGSMDIDPHSSSSAAMSPSRELLSLDIYEPLRQGTKKLAVVRVLSSFGEKPLETMDEIQGAVFGIGPFATKANVVDQWSQISHGQLTFEDGGVMEVTINLPVTGSDVLQTLIPEILHVAAEDSRIKEADHVAFCLPPGSTGPDREEWFAFAYSGTPYMFFQQGRCLSLSSVIHEQGHLLGLSHSGTVSDPYGDTSGYMGYSDVQFGRPVKAFNAHKHWISTWFPESVKETINADGLGETMWRMTSFTNSFDNILPGTKMLLRIDGTSQHLYLQYLLRTSYNVDMPSMYHDRISVVQARSALEESTLLAALKRGEHLDLEDGLRVAYCRDRLAVTVAAYNATRTTHAFCESSPYVHDLEETRGQVVYFLQGAADSVSNWWKQSRDWLVTAPSSMQSTMILAGASLGVFLCMISCLVCYFKFCHRRKRPGKIHKKMLLLSKDKKLMIQQHRQSNGVLPVVSRGRGLRNQLIHSRESLLETDDELSDVESDIGVLFPISCTELYHEVTVVDSLHVKHRKARDTPRSSPRAHTPALEVLPLNSNSYPSSDVYEGGQV